MQTPTLTPSIGSAERALRTLFERHLRQAGISFPAWTILALTNASPLLADQLVQRLLSGHVVNSTTDAESEIEQLLAAGLLFRDEGCLTNTGSELFQALAGKIKTITQALYGDLPGADLETTHRVLLEITRRANSLLTP